MIRYPVPRDLGAKEATAQCRLWIFDVSASMAASLPQVKADAIKLLDQCQPTDVLTILWFSSEGLRGTVVKGMVVGSNKAVIAKLLDQQLHPRNLTCFSETLEDSVQHIADLAAFGFPWSLFWFTDGHPVVSNLTRELERVMVALARLQPLVAHATLVGYGDYYNGPLLTRMAAMLGANLVLANDLSMLIDGLREHIEMLAPPRLRIPLADRHHALVGLGTGKVVTYPMVDGQGLVSPLESEVLGVGNLLFQGGQPTKPELYALALLAGREGDTDQALNILGNQLGDVRLTDMLTSAFTNAEIGAALTAVEEAVFNPESRFVKGRKKNYAGNRKAFCLINALEILEADPEARFVPDEGFVYRRTGVATHATEGATKFERRPDERVPFKLTWHDSRLNVALLVEYEGTVTVGEDYADVGLPGRHVACKQYRNYVIVKDGVLNVRVLPVTMGLNSFLALRRSGLIKRTLQYKPGLVIQLELDRIPVMNRAMADNLTAEGLARLASAQLAHEATLKVLKWLRHKLDPDQEQVPSPFTPAQREYLKAYDIDWRGWHAPKTVKEEPRDWYEARTFEIKIKGASSMPKVEDVLERSANNKPLNSVQAMIYHVYADHAFDTLAEIDVAIAQTKQALADLRHYINRARAAVILGHRWFPEFENRDDNVLVDSDGTTYTFALGTEKVPY